MITGTAIQRRRAKKYVNLIKLQRNGPVNISEFDNEDDDLSLLNVPVSCVGFVTGSGGSYLRHCEKQWKTLMLKKNLKNISGT